jgi:hypothetical protein
MCEKIPDSRRQCAFKLEQSGKAADWSISYYDGFDLSPDLSLKSITPSAISILLNHNRIRALRADAATTLGRYGCALR